MLTIKVYKDAVIFVISLLVATTLAHPYDDSDSTTYTPPAGSCELPYASKYHVGYNWPLVFRLNGSLFETANVDGTDSVVVPYDEEVIIACGPNYIKTKGQTEHSNAKCGEGRKFQWIGHNERENFRDLTCDMRVIEESMKTVYGCPINLTSTNYGYVHPLEGQTYVVGESCFDVKNGRTFFAHVKLGGPNEYLEKTDKTYLLYNRPTTKYKIELFKAFRFDDIYERVRSSLGPIETFGLKLSNFVDERLLMHNQLAAVKKLGWNYFLMRENLQTLNLLKEDIKEMSNSAEVDVYIGSHGVNVLQNSEGVQMELFGEISDGFNRFPMPELIWIVVKHGDRATAFAVFNDQNLQSEDIARRAVCRSECDKITWLSRVTDPRYRGPLICCRYDEFVQVVKEAPRFSGINGLFHTS